MLTVSKEFNMRKQRAKKKQDSDISIHLKRRKIIPVLPLKSPYKTIYNGNFINVMFLNGQYREFVIK